MKWQARCRVCVSPFRRQIEQAAYTDIGYGVIAAEYGVSLAGLSRHMSKHAPPPPAAVPPPRAPEPKVAPVAGKPANYFRPEVPLPAPAWPPGQLRDIGELVRAQSAKRDRAEAGPKADEVTAEAYRQDCERLFRFEREWPPRWPTPVRPRWKN